MPIYEYECLENGHQFETIQKISDKPLKSCKICDSPVRRLISNTAFILKGGGWYNENYSKKSTPAKTKGSESSTKESAEKPSTTKKPDSSKKASKE